MREAAADSLHILCSCSEKNDRKYPESFVDIQNALILMEKDVFDPSLKTHKLHGKLSGSWSCCAGYDLRIIFQLNQHEGQEAIFLETIGTHDAVY